MFVCIDFQSCPRNESSTEFHSWSIPHSANVFLPCIEQTNKIWIRSFLRFVGLNWNMFMSINLYDKIFLRIVNIRFEFSVYFYPKWNFCWRVTLEPRIGVRLFLSFFMRTCVMQHHESMYPFFFLFFVRCSLSIIARPSI